MNRLVCFKHSKYDGTTPPVLSCKACCKIYISEIKKMQPLKKFDAKSWLSDKNKASNHEKFEAFDPGII